MTTRTIRLPIYDIVITLEEDRGSLRSSLNEDAEPGDDPELTAAFDAIESLVLAHAVAGVNVEDPKYLEGLEVAIEACGNQY